LQETGAESTEQMKEHIQKLLRTQTQIKSITLTVASQTFYFQESSKKGDQIGIKILNGTDFTQDYNNTALQWISPFFSCKEASWIFGFTLPVKGQ